MVSQVVAEPLDPIVWVKGPDGRAEYIDPRGTEFFGRASKHICRQSWLDLIHPDDADAARRAWMRARDANEPYTVVVRMRDAAGTYHPMVERGAPVLGRSGTIINWGGTLTRLEDDDARRRHPGLRSEAAETRAILDTLLDSAPVGFVYVDREFRYVRVNEKVAAIHGSASVQEHLGHTVAEVVPTLWAQLEAAYRHVLESGVPVLNIELSGATAEDPGRVHHWLESIYPVRVGPEITGLGVVLIDITERKKAETVLQALTEAAVDAIAAAAEARDPYTAGHQRRVAELSVAIARELGMNYHEIEGVRMAARIHDVGKLRMPSEILNKPGPLRSSELALLKEHAQAGADIVRGIEFPWPIADLIVQHHERIDGSGYPHGLSGDEILVGARILAVADVVDAMSSHRPYRPSRGLDAALAHIIDDRGTRLDPEIVDICVRLFRQQHFAFSVSDPSEELSKGPTHVDDHEF